MSDPIVYSQEEAREILIDHVISLDAHLYLESRLEQFVRAEDHERPSLMRECVRHIWTESHPEWNWDDPSPELRENEDFLNTRNAVLHWFRFNGRIRGARKRQPHEISESGWTGEDVCGQVYKKAIFEWIETKGGFTPGYADNFLEQYRAARREIYQCMPTTQKQALQRTADDWNNNGFPKEVQMQNFNNHFASACRAFGNKCMKEFGVFPFVFYTGMPGHNIPPNMFEIMRKEGLAGDTFRRFTKLDNLFQDMQAYVNTNAAALYHISGKRPPSMRSAAHLKHPEYDICRADIEGNRLLLDPERLPEGWENHSAHLFYQLVTFAHSIITNARKTPPPWTALSSEPEKLIAKECLLPSHKFGISPEKTQRDIRNALIRHWCHQVGYLEFHHSSYHSVYKEPTAERWYEREKCCGSLMDAWMSTERSCVGAREKGSRTIPSVTPMRFGSKGPRPALDSQSPFAGIILQEDGDAICSDDPTDRLTMGRPSFHPGKPSWPAPCLAPATAYARLQWSSQCLGEIGGYAADTLLRAAQWLAQMPLVPMRDYDISWFRPSDTGAKRNFLVETLRDWISWDMDRGYLCSQQEVDELGSFLKSRAWTFVGNSKVRFAGVQMTWTIVLASILYLRALRHSEEIITSPPSRWALSGNADWQAQAAKYRFPLDMEGLRIIVRDLCGYLEGLCLSITAPGLPPSLLYLQYRDRLSYVRALVSREPALLELWRLVRKMPVDSESVSRYLPGFETNSPWQHPHLGMPRQAHSATVDSTRLEQAIRDKNLFLRVDGVPHGFEAGLTSLLQYALILSEIEHLSTCAETQLPPYLVSSPYRTDSAFRDGIKASLLEAAHLHSAALQAVLPAYSTSQDYASEVEQSYDGADEWPNAEDILAGHDLDLDAQIRERAQQIDSDPLQKRLAAMYTQQRNRDDRRKLNEQLRNDQNAINLLHHDTIHPPKPPRAPVAIPDLDDLYDHPQAELPPAGQEAVTVDRAATGRTQRVANTTGVLPRPPPAVTPEEFRDVAIAVTIGKGRPRKRDGMSRPKGDEMDKGVGKKVSKKRSAIQAASQRPAKVARGAGGRALHTAPAPAADTEMESFDLGIVSEGSSDEGVSTAPRIYQTRQRNLRGPSGMAAYRSGQPMAQARDAEVAPYTEFQTNRAFVQLGQAAPVVFSAESSDSDSSERVSESEIQQDTLTPFIRPRPKIKTKSSPPNPGISTAF